MPKFWQRFFVLSSVTLLVVLCPAAIALNESFVSSAPTPQAFIPITAPDNFAGCGGNPIDVVNQEFEQKVAEMTNRVRAEQGLPPLKRVDGLNQSARYHAADMNIDDYFSHNTHDRAEGDLMEVCDTWQRIDHFYTNWVALAENIAAGQRTPEIAMDGWMNSPDHYHNIVSKSYWEIGTGFFQGEGTYHYYWVQNFGKKDGRYPLVIAGEAIRTYSRDVEVYVYGEWQEIRLRVNQGEWSDWYAFKPKFTWKLPAAPGEYMITAELRGITGNVTTGDSIVLSEPDSSSVNRVFDSLWLGQ